jgi:hypothetical protein
MCCVIMCVTHAWAFWVDISRLAGSQASHTVKIDCSVRTLALICSVLEFHHVWALPCCPVSPHLSPSILWILFPSQWWSCSSSLRLQLLRESQAHLYIIGFLMLCSVCLFWVAPWFPVWWPVALWWWFPFLNLANYIVFESLWICRVESFVLLCLAVICDLYQVGVWSALRRRACRTTWFTDTADFSLVRSLILKFFISAVPRVWRCRSSWADSRSCSLIAVGSEAASIHLNSFHVQASGSECLGSLRPLYLCGSVRWTSVFFVSVLIMFFPFNLVNFCTFPGVPVDLLYGCRCSSFQTFTLGLSDGFYFWIVISCLSGIR